MRKIWNRPDLAVWSLVTIDEIGNANMNICTYVTAVSMDPKLMLVAVYHGTKTRSNIEIGGRVLLQLLGQEHAPLVRLLGHESGHTVDKIARLTKRHKLQYKDNLPYIASIPGYLLAEVEQLFATTGDHDLAIVRVLTQKNLHDVPILTTNELRRRGYLRG